MPLGSEEGNSATISHAVGRGRGAPHAFVVTGRFIPVGNGAQQCRWKRTPILNEDWQGFATVTPAVNCCYVGKTGTDGDDAPLGAEDKPTSKLMYLSRRVQQKAPANKAAARIDLTSE